MTLRRIALLLSALFVAIAVAGGVGLWLTLDSRENDRNTARRYLAAQTDVARLQTAFSDQETGQRGYVLTGDITFLAPYTAGTTTTPRLERSIASALEGNGALLRDLAAVRHAGSRWQTLGAAPEIELRASGAVDRAIAGIATGPGKELFDALRGRLATLSGRLDAAVDEKRAAVDRANARLTIAASVTLVLVVVGAALVVVALRRWVLAPVGAIRAAARRVVQGELDTAVPATGPTELRELGVDVELMRREIVHELDLAVRASDALQQQASVVLALSASLETATPDLGPDWSAATALRPAEGIVAGDCFDLAVLAEGSMIAVSVLDVAGHGPLAALVALRCKEQLRALVGSGVDPGEAIANVATSVTGLEEGGFFTAVLALIDLVTGRCVWANAGHPPAIICRDGAPFLLEPTGPLAGPLAGPWTTREVHLAPGDRLVLYTDGITEARNPAGEFLGIDPLVDIVCAADGASAEHIVEECIRTLDEFSPGPHRDDVTMVAIVHRER